MKNRFFCEIALENRNIIGNSIKIEILRKFALKNRFFLWNCLKESKFFGNFPRKSKFVYPGPQPPDFKPDWRRCQPTQWHRGLHQAKPGLASYPHWPHPFGTRKGGGAQRVKARFVSIDDHLTGLRGVEPKVVVECPRFNPVKLGCKRRVVGRTDRQVRVICVL